MIRLLVLAFALLALWPARSDDAVPVTITKRAPIETLGPDGTATGVSEARAGDKYTFVSIDSGKIVLQDAKGTHYRVALAATDYVPPAAPAPATTAAVAPATPSPAPVTPPTHAPAPAMPPPPVIPPPATETAAAATPGSGNLPPDSAMQTLQMGERTTAKDMSIWPPGGIAGRPLLIAAHGNGGAGPREIKGWLKLARTHNFTIVCPSFLSSVNAGNLPADEPYFNDCIKWMKTNLQFDHGNVFMAGFSGGGFPTWYLATKHPEFFHGLAFQSGNFAGNYYNLDLDKWFNRPIKLIWGSADLADIPVQNKSALDTLKAQDCKDYTSEIVPGGHHQEHPDIVVTWMEQNLAPPSDP